MKKNLLLASGLLLIASASFAQGLRVPAHLSKMKPLPVEANTETPTTATPRPMRTPVAHTSNRTTAVLVRKSIGTASNSYGVFYHPMNQVSYNPDINAIAFGHRGGGTKGGAAEKSSRRGVLPCADDNSRH